jgi:hypothetical protein
MIQDLNEIIINLNIISSITRYKKIITRENLLNIEKYDSTSFNIFQPIKRWFNGDSREATLIKLDKVITNACDLINKKCNDQKTLIKYTIKSKIGLNNLKETYKTCPQTMARIDVIIDKIDMMFNNVKPLESDSNIYENNNYCDNELLMPNNNNNKNKNNNEI